MPSPSPSPSPPPVTLGELTSTVYEDEYPEVQVPEATGIHVIPYEDENGATLNEVLIQPPQPPTPTSLLIFETGCCITRT